MDQAPSVQCRDGEDPLGPLQLRQAQNVAEEIAPGAGRPALEPGRREGAIDLPLEEAARLRQRFEPPVPLGEVAAPQRRLHAEGASQGPVGPGQRMLIQAPAARAPRPHRGEVEVVQVGGGNVEFSQRGLRRVDERQPRFVLESGKAGGEDGRPRETARLFQEPRRGMLPPLCSGIGARVTEETLGRRRNGEQVETPFFERPLPRGRGQASAQPLPQGIGEQGVLLLLGRQGPVGHAHDEHRVEGHALRRGDGCGEDARARRADPARGLVEQSVEQRREPLDVGGSVNVDAVGVGQRLDGLFDPVVALLRVGPPAGVVGVVFEHTGGPFGVFSPRAGLRRRAAGERADEGTQPLRRDAQCLQAEGSGRRLATRVGALGLAEELPLVAFEPVFPLVGAADHADLGGDLFPPWQGL